MTRDLGFRAIITGNGGAPALPNEGEWTKRSQAQMGTALDGGMGRDGIPNSLNYTTLNHLSQLRSGKKIGIKSYRKRFPVSFTFLLGKPIFTHIQELINQPEGMLCR